MDEQTAFIDLAANGEILPPMPRNGDGTALGPTLTEYDLFTTEGALQPLLDKVKGYVTEFPGADVSTETGRAFIRSFAYKIVKTRTLIESRGKSIADRQKAIPKLIDNARRYAKTYLEHLEDEFRKPLTDWEDAEKTRKDKHLAAIMAINEAGAIGVPRPVGIADISIPKAADLRVTIQHLETMAFSELECQEFFEEYEHSRTSRIAFLKDRVAEREKWEADQAELAELRQKQLDRDFQEAQERQQREDAEAAEQRKQDRELAAKRVEEKAQQRAQELADAKERERLAVEAAEKAAEEKRAANKRHRAKVNNEAVAVLTIIVAEQIFQQQPPLLEVGFDATGIAKAILTAIAKGEIPRVVINY